jgi:sugar lactone lactonase YvrE
MMSNSIECVYATIENKTNAPCKGESVSSFPDTQPINNQFIKLIYSNKTGFVPHTDYQYLFISDTKNHCIRKMDLLTAEVTTYAGICGTSGFKDGPLGTNLFNLPDGMGVDTEGYLYVFDSANIYIRLIDPTGKSVYLN